MKNGAESRLLVMSARKEDLMWIAEMGQEEEGETDTQNQTKMNNKSVLMA